MRRLALSLCCCLTAGLTIAAKAGGFAVVTVENPPDRLVAGQPVEMSFVVRQHGVTPMPNLNPRIEARSGLRVVEGRAWETPRRGVYRARITVPDARKWLITIHSGFLKSKGRLVPMRAVDASAPAAPIANEERGRQLFAAKGCVTCHVHDSVTVGGEFASMELDLTDRRFPAQYLASFLANPAIKKPTNPSFPMPNFQLSQREIAALVAFINSERQLTHR